MGQVVSQNLNNISLPKGYALSDIIVVQDSPTVARTYAETVSLIFSNYMPRENEALLAQKAFDDNDMDELAAIDPLITSYKTIVSRPLATPAPRAIAQYHLNLTNGFNIALYNAQSLRHLDTDPVRGFSAVSLELVGIQTISSAISNLQGYFASQGIPF